MVGTFVHQEPVGLHAGQHRESPANHPHAKHGTQFQVLRRENPAAVSCHAQGTADEG